MVAKSVIDSRLWIRLDFDPTLKGNSFFHTNPLNRAHLANQLLLYDRIIIPTKDYGIVPILISWLGLSTFIEALEAGAFGFVRLESFLGYQSDGVGLSTFKIEETGEFKFQWWQAAEFGPYETAPDIQLRYLCPFLSEKERVELTRLILENSRQYELERDVFRSRIIHETYTDVTTIPSLVNYLSAHEPPTKKIHPNRLSGFQESGIKILNLEKIQSSIDLVLRVAEINLELMLGFDFDESDLSTSYGADNLLKGKIIRCGAVQELSEKFQSLLVLERIPDISPAVINGEITLPEIWKIRQELVSVHFREWLRSSNPSDSLELQQAYLASVRKTGKYASLPLKAIRFLLTYVIGRHHPDIAAILAATDSFFVEKWLEGYSPSLFMDSIRELPKV